MALALEWLVRQQRKDGLWSLTGPYVDGSRQENRLAASAMALLALQGAGNTPTAGEHRQAVAKAWKALLRLQQPDGTFDTGLIIEQHEMYAHGQVTIALCEAYGMTHDSQLKEPAARAPAYAVAAQMPDGGWRYQPPRPDSDNRGDMSVTGWFLMALKSGEMAGLDVPAEAYERLAAFLDGVFVSAEKGYGYQINPGQKVFDFRPPLTAEALLCRQYLGWRRDDPRLAAGVELLLREAPGPSCGGDIRLIAFITEPGPIRKILAHLGEPLEPPPLLPARGPPNACGELVQMHDDRDVFQASPDDLPAIDIHSL